jgi:hypothetical protein
LKLIRNYIGVLSDETDEQRVIASLAKSDRVVKDCLIGLMFSELHRGEAR